MRSLAAFVLGVATADYNLVMYDDFDGYILNNSLWSKRNNVTHGPVEFQLYLSEDCWLDGNSNLVLRTRWNPTYYGTKLYNYTSCWIDSADKPGGELTYGRWDIRAKLPNPQALDVWPALWLVDDNNHCWPVGGEIDIMEAVGGVKNNSVFGTYHWGAACGVDAWSTTGQYNQIYPNASNGQGLIDFSQDYHVFSVEWNVTSVRWFVDDVFYVRRDVNQPEGLFIPAWPLYTIFNVAISPWGPQQPPRLDNWPTFMYVDWVKVWQDPDGEGQRLPVETT